MEYTTDVNIENIETQGRKIHPALDWVDGQLIVGVALKDKKRAILSSNGRYIRPEALGDICERARNFESSVTPECVRAFFHGDRKLEDDAFLLARLSTYIQRFVVFPENWMAETVAAWILATYVYPIFQAFPYVWITSETPGCGKSVLGQVIARLGFNGDFMTAPNEAHLFRLAESNRGVQVWDEVEFKADVERKRFESIKGVLLNGYRNGGVVPRQVGRNWECIQRFHVFCPRVFIGLSELPEPALQRTIRIAMQKRPSDRRQEIYNAELHEKEEQELRSACLLWALRNAAKVAALYNNNELRGLVERSVGDVGREADDIWLPLFAIVKTALGEDPLGAEWLEALKSGASAHRAKPTFTGLPRVKQYEYPSESTVHDGAGVNDENDGDGLVAGALMALRGGLPLTPSDLANAVGDVHPQTLSKLLKSIGVTARKEKGRRVFCLSKKQLEVANKWLVRHGYLGQEGQQGQEIQIM